MHHGILNAAAGRVPVTVKVHHRKHLNPSTRQRIDAEIAASTATDSSPRILQLVRPSAHVSGYTVPTPWYRSSMHAHHGAPLWQLHFMLLHGAPLWQLHFMLHNGSLMHAPPWRLIACCSMASQCMLLHGSSVHAHHGAPPWQLHFMLLHGALP